MNKLLLSSVVAVLLSGIMPIHADLIVYGTLSGTVTSIRGEQVFATVGTPVSGYFIYDYDLLLPPDASGLRTLVNNEGQATFYIWPSAGIGGSAGYNFDLVVDANGLPYSGIALGNPDLSIIPGGTVDVIFPGDNLWVANVTYTITSPVPDAAATWFLLGLGLAGVIVAWRCFRQAPV